MQKLSSWILWASKHCCGSDSCLESQLQYPAGEPENDNKSCRLTCFLKNNHGAMLHHFRRCCLMVKDFGSYGVKLNWSWLLSEANCLLIRVCYDLLRFTPVPWSVSSWFWFYGLIVNPAEGSLLLRLVTIFTLSLYSSLLSFCLSKKKVTK